MEAASVEQEESSSVMDSQDFSNDNLDNDVSQDNNASQQPREAKPKPKPKPVSSLKQIPKDFATRAATRITAINERELDEEIASSNVATMLFKNMNSPEYYPYFTEMIDILLQSEHTQKYAATAFTALLWHEDIHPEYREFVNDLLGRMVDGHIKSDLPTYEHEDTGKEFSSYAYTLGETFIQMMRLNSDLYNILTDIYSYVIRKEMTRDLEKSQEDSKKKAITGRRKTKASDDVNTKKLYDDIVDYISDRGDFRSDTLNQKNPNEFIIILADRMRSTRRYVIQDIMNRHALEKKKVLEKELREREANAEEVINASEPFKHGLYLFWVEKRYNFKYLAVEKVRITLQILAIFMGLGAIGTGFLGLGMITLMEGLLVGAAMIAYAQLFCSRFIFASFYPKDVTVELEKDVGAYTPTFRKMSLQQINAFMVKQIKDNDNSLLLHLLPEYVRYIFAVMPDRNDILLSKDNINEFMERLEINLSKHQRGK
ncbi:MAG: hypothetical protein GY866_36185 [Proteobacteria bacterium]|nr:hypothetical protein [Pseudomonadota bacterium]